MLVLIYAQKISHIRYIQTYLHSFHYSENTHSSIVLVELLVDGNEALEAGGRRGLELQLAVV